MQESGLPPPIPAQAYRNMLKIPSVQRSTISIDELFRIHVSELCLIVVMTYGHGISFGLSVCLWLSKDQGMTVRFGMNSSSDAESFARRMPSTSRRQVRAGCVGEDEVDCASRGERRLARADGCRYERPFWTLQYYYYQQIGSSSKARVHASRLCCVCTVVHMAWLGCPSLSQKLDWSIALQVRQVEGCLVTLAGVSVRDT